MSTKTLLPFIKTYLIFLGSCLLLLWLSASFPSQLMDKQIKSTIDLLETEGTYPTIGVRPRKIILDNFTDALMINTAYSMEDSSPKTFMLNGGYMASPNEINQIENLKATYEKNFSIRPTYSRYWHGYLVYLRPLLTTISYADIRIILTVSLFTSFISLLYLLIDRVNLVRGLAVLSGAIAVDFFYLGNSLQFTSVFLIGIIASIAYLLSPKIRKNKLLYFFVVGMATSFFDLLTAPLVTLGFLLIVATKDDDISKLIKRCLAWGLGYAGFWASKWVLVEFFFAPGTFSQSLGHVRNRSISPADATFSHFKTLSLNLNQLFGYDKLSKEIVLAIGILLFLAWLKLRKQQINLKSFIFWLVMASLPYAWYLFAANHSYLHVWYTYRAQFLTVAAGCLAYAELIDKEKVLELLSQIASKRR